MPNWYYNELTVMGDKTEIDRFDTAFHGDEADFEGAYRKMGVRCMNALVPVPPEVLMNGFSVWHRGEGDDPTYTDAYGYGWCRNHWGTKWDICYWHDQKPGHYVFDTAWAPPLMWLKTIQKMFPALHFELDGYDAG
jgi:hypothetical protein